MAKETIIIKLGGSLVTNKKSLTPEINNGNLSIIKSILKKSNFDLIIVHGAGSFGHPIAKKFNIIGGLDGSQEQKKAINETRKQVKKLNNLLCEILNNSGLDTVTIAPSDSMKTKGPKNIQNLPFKLFDEAISEGKTPVTFGDVTKDNLQGVTVLSGDVLMMELAKHYKPKFSIFVMDYPGVFDGDPKDTRSKKINLVNSETINNLKKQKIVQRGTDVTGGLIGKLECAREISNYSEVWITNLKSLKGFLNGNTEGSRVVV